MKKHLQEIEQHQQKLNDCVAFEIKQFVESLAVKYELDSNVIVAPWGGVSNTITLKTTDVSESKMKLIREFTGNYSNGVNPIQLNRIEVNSYYSESMTQQAWKWLKGNFKDLYASFSDDLDTAVEQVRISHGEWEAYNFSKGIIACLNGSKHKGFWGDEESVEIKGQIGLFG